MRKWWGLLVVGLVLVGMGLVTQARSQSGIMYWQCAPPTTAQPQGSFCPVNLTYPAPVQNQGSSSAVITPNDSTVLSPTPKALYVGDASACSISMQLVNDSSAVTWTNLPSGSFVPVRPAIVKSTGTTCATIIATY